MVIKFDTQRGFGAIPNNRPTLVFIPHLDVGEQTPHGYWVPTIFFI